MKSESKDPFHLSLKNSLKEEFLEHGIKIINETKDKLIEILEKYCSDLVLSYKKTLFKPENKGDFLMSMSNRKLDDEVSLSDFNSSKENRKILINEQKISEFDIFLRNCLSISQISDSSPKAIENFSNNSFMIKPPNYNEKPNYFYLHAILPKFNSLFLFDINNESSLYVSIKKRSNFEIPSNPSTFQIAPEIIIIFSGHYRNLSEISLETYSLNLKTFEMKNLECRTNFAKIANGICLCDQFLYSIGGKMDLNKRTNLCERLNIKNFRWEKFPALKYTRSSPSALVFNKEIFVFFGLDERNQVCNKIEKIFPGDKEWSELKFRGFFEKKPIFQASCLQINEDEIIIFGGYHVFEKGRAGNDEIFVANMKNEEVFNVFKPHPLLQGSSQICHSLFNDQNEIISLRYVNNELGEKIGEFEEIFGICAVNGKGCRVVEIVNCRLFEKIINK